VEISSCENKEKKWNDNSLVINKIIPYCNPLKTFDVCHTWKVLSRISNDIIVYLPKLNKKFVICCENSNIHQINRLSQKLW